MPPLVVGAERRPLEQRNRQTALSAPVSLSTAEVLDAKFDSGRPFDSKAPTLAAAFVLSLVTQFAALASILAATRADLMPKTRQIAPEALADDGIRCSPGELSPSIWRIVVSRRTRSLFPAVITAKAPLARPRSGRKVRVWNIPSSPIGQQARPSTRCKEASASRGAQLGSTLGRQRGLE